MPFQTKNCAYIERNVTFLAYLVAKTGTKLYLGTVTIAGSQHQQPKWDLKLA